METREQNRVPNILARAGGVLAAGLGLVVLLGWVLGLPLLASSKPHWIPMAPSGALLFLLFGAAVFASARAPISRPVQRTAMLVGSVSTLAALLLFFLSWQGIHPDAGHFGMAIAESATGIPIGHISPLTALGFVLAGLSFLASLGLSPARPWHAAAGFCFAGFLVCASVVFLLGYLFGAPLLYGERFIPPALPTSLAFAALGTALLALTGPRAWASDERIDAASLRASRSFMLVFALVAAGLVAVGHVHVHDYEQRYRTEFERQLSAVAELKAGELAAWRAERLADATVLFRSAVFAALVRRALGNPKDLEAQEQLHGWLRQVREAYRYAQVSLMDTRGVARISISDKPLPANAPEPAREALRSGQIAFLDFHRDVPGSTIHLSILIPIAGAKEGDRPLGVVVLDIDPSQYLYPFIQRWPTPSRTAETLLVRRDGNDVLFLNELRFQKNTALALRIPLDNIDVPAVQAVLGQEGIVAGVDYRGVPVIAALRAVPGSAWFLIARVDTAEVFDPITEHLWLMVGLIGALLLAAGATVGLVWRHQRVRHYQERLRAAEALSASATRYRAVTQTATDAIVTADASGMIAGWNSGAERMFGYTETEIIGQALTQLMPQRYRDGHLEGMQRVQADGERHILGKTAELHGLTKAGIEFPLELSLSEWETSEGRFFTGIMRDISERKQAERALARQKDLYAMLSQTNQTIVRLASREELFPAICRIAVEYGHFRFAWIGLIAAQDPWVRPVARYGEDAGYMEQARICADDSDPVGRGPTGQALRTGQHAVSNDFMNDPATAPWHEAARRAGVRASAAFPIRERNSVVACINLYADEPGFFSEEVLATLDEIAIDLSFALGNFAHQAELRRAQEVLREALQRLRFHAENSPLAVVEFDREFRVIFWSNVAQRVFGWSAEEILGKRIDQLRWVHEEDAARVAALGADMFAGRQTRNLYTNRNYRKDGSVITCEWYNSALVDSAGDLVSVLSLVVDVTERKRAEEALRESEQKLRLIAENATDVIVAYDMDRRLIYVNPAVEELTGYTVTELRERNFINWLHPEDEAKTKALWEDLFVGKGFSGEEFRIVTKDGQIKWCSSSWGLLYDESGRQIGVQGRERDITKRKQAEMALRASEAMLRYYVENTPAAIAMFDTGMRYLLTSKRWLTDYRLGERDVTGISHYEVFPEIPERWKEIHRRCLAGATERCEEDPFPRQDGSLDWVRWDVRPWWNSSGVIGGIIMFTEVITERKRAEEDVRQMALMVDTAPSSIAVHDFDGRYLYANQKTFDLHGFSRDEFMALTLHQLDVPASERLITARMQELRDRGEAFFEVAHFRKDGTRLPLEVRAKVTTWGGKKVILSVATDITERKQAEQTLHDYARRLQSVSRRLIAVEEIERRNINRELHDRVGANLSALNLDLSIVRSQLPQESLGVVGARLEDTQKLLEETTTHVRDLMADLHPPALDDYGLLAALRTYVHELGARTAVPIGLHGEPFVPRLPLTAETALFRVAQGAIVNAVTHAQAKRIEILLAASPDRVALTVADDGAGFDVAQAAQAHASWGLAIMRERAEAVGAELSVESTPGKGTRIRVEISREQR